MKSIVLASVLFGLTAMSPESCEGYRILGMFPLHAKSHHMMFDALMKGLARKGHQVDVVSPFPQKKPYPNLTDIIVLPLYMPRFVNNMTYDSFRSMGHDMVHFVATETGTRVCEGLGHPEMQKLIQNPPKDPPYDLVLTEIFGAHCYMAFGHHLKIPMVAMSSSALYPWAHGMVGNPKNLAFVPNNLLNYVAPMTFWQRLHNTVHDVYCDLAFKYYSSPQDEIIKKYFGKDAPSVRELERSAALVLTNSHPALSGSKPVTPAVIEVGGLHVQDDGTELPRDLEEWMDNSKEGFVYFTFGSMVVIETFPEEVIRVFYKSLEKIAPIRVLMKIPNPKKLPPGLPKNIRTFEWAPQYKVLSHKNVKAFITHGGLMGTQEAIHCAVPMIGMPLFGDQFINIDLYSRRKMAVRLNYQGITEEKMDTALNEILFNPVYKNTMIKVSTKFLDRPMSSMDTATWWVEYVIRHGGDVLRSPAMDLTWWQVHLLDIYGVLMLIAAFLIFTIIAVVRFFVKNIIFIVAGHKVTHSKKVK